MSSSRHCDQIRAFSGSPASFGDAASWGVMELEYTFHIITDGQLSTSELYAADDDAARNQALLATSEAFKDHALQGLPFATISVKVENSEGEAILHARIEVSENPFATDPGADVWLDA